MVATGIAAYTAFLSVGLIEMFPAHAFNPAIWALPTIGRHGDHPLVPARLKAPPVAAARPAE